MSRTRVALLASCIWMVAALAGGTAIAALGLRPLTIFDLVVLAAAASGATYALAVSGDRRAEGTLARGAGSVGVAEREGARIEPIAVTPPVRTEMTAEHLGFAALSAPALVVTEDGAVLATTRGFEALVPDLGERANIAAIFGLGHPVGDWSAAETLAIVAGQRFRIRSSTAGLGRLLLELLPEALPIADDDLDVFAEAVARGLTGFRFEAARATDAPALDALNGVIAELDDVAAAIAGISAGTGAAREYLRRNGGLAPLLRVLDDDVRALAGERDEEAALRLGLEAKLMAIARAIDGYRLAAEYTAQETRALVAHSGGQSAQGLAETAALQHAFGDLAGHLRNLSDDRGMMAQSVEAEGAAPSRGTDLVVHDGLTPRAPEQTGQDKAAA